jgi:hypothetical protein
MWWQCPLNLEMGETHAMMMLYKYHLSAAIAVCLCVSFLVKVKKVGVMRDISSADQSINT